MAQTLFDRMFNIPDVDASSLFSPMVPKGSGSDDVDDYIAKRVAMLSDRPDTFSNKYEAARGEIASRESQQLPEYIKGTIASSSEKVKNDILQRYTRVYGETKDPRYLDKTREAMEEVTPKNEAPLREALPKAVVEMLNSAGDSSIKRAAVRRDLLYGILGNFLKDTGEWDDWKDYITSGLGLFVPFRQTVQFSKKGNSFLPFKGVKEYKEQVKRFHQMAIEEQIPAYQEALQEIFEQAGENPLMFLERAIPYIDREEIGAVNLSLALDAVDAALVAPAIIKVAKFIRGASTPIKLARNAGNPKAAAEMVNEVLDDVDGRAGAALGIDKVDAAATASPFQGEGAIPSITNGLAAETQKLITEKLMEGRTLANKTIYDPNFFISRSPLTEAEQTVAQRKYLEQYADDATIVSSNSQGFTVRVGVESSGIRPVNLDEIRSALATARGTKAAQQERLSALKEGMSASEFSKDPEVKTIQDALFEADLDIARLEGDLNKATDAIGPHTALEYEDVSYTVNDVGELEATSYSRASRFLNSEDFVVGQMQKGVVGDAQVIDFESNKVAKSLETIARNAFAPLNKSRRKKVERVVLQGDKDKVNRYSASDLIEGIATDRGIEKLDTVEEFVAYHTYRDLSEGLHFLKNRELRRQLEFNKFKSIAIPIGDTQVPFFVKPAGRKHVNSDIKQLYDMEEGKIVDVANPSTINDRIDNEGWTLQKLKYPMEEGTSRVNYVLAKPEHLKGLPTQVLNQRPGHVPKMYKNIFFVAERTVDGLVDGAKSKFTHTARYFDSKRDAELWARMQQAKGDEVTVRSGKEWLDTRPGAKEEFEESVFGGLYSGKRAEIDVPFGLEGTEAERIPAFQALEKYIANVSGKLPYNEFRMGMVRKFLNSARDPLTGKSFLSNPGDWKSPIAEIDSKTSKSLDRGDPRYKGLTAFQGWLKDILRVEGPETRAWRAMTSKIGNVLEGRALLGSKSATTALRRFSYNLGKKDLTSGMRSLAFHSMLGFFNPAQLGVQAMGAAIAWSIDPVKAPRLTAQYLPFRFAVWSDNPQVWRKAAAAALTDPDEFEEFMRAFKKTGLMESVRSTADYSAAVHGMGVSGRSLKNAADKGLIFFREGETFVRYYGWALAREEFLKGRKGYKFTDADIDKITKRSLDFTLNLNRTNRAYWQKGLLSIPTQFMQIMAKFIEKIGYSVEKGGWTKAQKAKIMTGHALMFGAAGVPAGNWFLNNLAQWAKSDEDYGLGIKDEEVIKALSGGVLEWVISAMTGQEGIDISSRVSIPEGIEFFLETLIDTDKSTFEKVQGAFGQLPHRTFEIASALAPLMNTNPVTDWDNKTFANIAHQLGKLTSSYRNVDKARSMVALQAIVNSRGEPIAHLNTDENPFTVWAQAAGFQPALIDDYYELRDFNRSNQQTITSAVDAWEVVIKEWASSEQKGNKRYESLMQHMVEGIFSHLTLQERQEAALLMKQRLKDKDYLLVKELTDAIENLYRNEGQTVMGPFQGNVGLNPLLTSPENRDNTDAN